MDKLSGGARPRRSSLPRSEGSVRRATGRRPTVPSARSCPPVLGHVAGASRIRVPAYGPGATRRRSVTRLRTSSGQPVQTVRVENLSRRRWTLAPLPAPVDNTAMSFRSTAATDDAAIVALLTESYVGTVDSDRAHYVDELRRWRQLDDADDDASVEDVGPTLWVVRTGGSGEAMVTVRDTVVRIVTLAPDDPRVSEIASRAIPISGIPWLLRRRVPTVG